jgi:hypothetical protein
MEHSRQSLKKATCKVTEQGTAAIDKLLDQEHARRDPEPLEEVAEAGLRGLSAIDESASEVGTVLASTMSELGDGGGHVLRWIGGLFDRALEVTAAAERQFGKLLQHLQTLTSHILLKRAKGPALSSSGLWVPANGAAAEWGVLSSLPPRPASSPGPAGEAHTDINRSTP